MDVVVEVAVPRRVTAGPGVVGHEDAAPAPGLVRLDRLDGDHFIDLGVQVVDAVTREARDVHVRGCVDSRRKVMVDGPGNHIPLVRAEEFGLLFDELVVQVRRYPVFRPVPAGRADE